MFSNTYLPHVGGVARSVSGLVDGLRAGGHDVLVIAPEFDGAEVDGENVVRIPAVTNFSASDFSIPIPLSRKIRRKVREFNPDIIHSHHPFLLGDTALRTSAELNLPIVFTHHTRYDIYSHYLAQGSRRFERLALSVSLGYCDLCDEVIAPSESIAGFLRDNDMAAPVTVIPTGVDPAKFEGGDGRKARVTYRIPENAFVVGHVGRLAEEKNLGFLISATLKFLAKHPDAHAVFTGDGAEREKMLARVRWAGMGDRVHFTGILRGDALRDIFAAFDVFAFSSRSETQGLVIAEAMMAGVPVIALDAPGVREVVEGNVNGHLLPKNCSENLFAEELARFSMLDDDERRRMSAGAKRTARGYTIANCNARMISVYEHLKGRHTKNAASDKYEWQRTIRGIAAEMKIFGNYAQAFGGAVFTLRQNKKNIPAEESL